MVKERWKYGEVKIEHKLGPIRMLNAVRCGDTISTFCRLISHHHGSQGCKMHVNGMQLEFRASQTTLNVFKVG